MKFIKNTRGMTLLSVLLIVAVFFILGITLFTLSITNAKQITTVERDMQSVDVAEMGVVKYRNALIVSINSYFKHEIEKTIKDFSTYNEKNPTQPKAINGQTIFSAMYSNNVFSKTDLYKPHIALNTAYYIDTPLVSHYKISHFNAQLSGNTTQPLLIITFLSTGYVNGKASKIWADYAFDFPKMIDAALQNRDDTESTSPLPHGNQGSTLVAQPEFSYIPPTVNGTCVNSSSTNCTHVGNLTTNPNTSNVHVVVENNLSSTGGQTDIKDSNIYIRGNINFDNFNSIERTTLFGEKNGTFKISDKGLIDSNFFFSQDLSFSNMNGNAKISGSNFSVLGNLTIGDVNAGLSKTNVYTNGNVSFGHFNNGGFHASIIYANGNVMFQNLNTGMSDAKIYSGGNLTIGSLNGPILNTTIHVKGNLSLSTIDRPITSSTIYVEGNLVASGANNNDFTDTIICVAGTISNSQMAEKENGANKIYSKAKNEKIYNQFCPPPGIEHETTLSIPTIDLSENLLEAINKGEYGYE